MVWWFISKSPSLFIYHSYEHVTKDAWVVDVWDSQGEG